MKKINPIDSIKHPIVTEKATIMSEQNKSNQSNSFGVNLGKRF